MGLILKQLRECDGKCCSESPRFPNIDHTDCIYRDPSKPDKGCLLIEDPSQIPVGDSPVFNHLTALEAFEKTCLGWPEVSEPKIGETGNCCWQWVEE